MQPDTTVQDISLSLIKEQRAVYSNTRKTSTLFQITQKTNTGITANTAL